MKTLIDCEKADELINIYDFPPNLLVDNEYCEKIYGHCKKYGMKFLKGSYGTIVHKDFDKQFKTISKGFDHLEDETIKDKVLDHSNLIQCKQNKDITLLTSSPYLTLREDRFGIFLNYPYKVYVINPNYLDYIEFARQFYGKVRVPMQYMNYAFTDACEVDMMVLNDHIYEETGLFPTFLPLKEFEPFYYRKYGE